MINKIVEKWTPEITRVLYRSAENRRTIKLVKLHILCEYEFKDDPGLFLLLDAIDNIEYAKHGIFLSALVLRDTGKKLPSEIQFDKVYRRCQDSKEATYTDVCIKERERAFRIAYELTKNRKSSVPEIF